MRRREALAVLGGMVVAPAVSRAQAPAMPVIGFLNSASAQRFGALVAAFRQGLKQAGYVEGQNVRIEYRWADDDEERLRTQALDLVGRGVTLIAATGGIRSAQIARAVTSTIPVLFIAGSDPVRLGLVASINRPGGNATGMSVDTTEMFPKRLELLRELVPQATSVAMLVGVGPYTPAFERAFAESNGLLVLTVGEHAESQGPSLSDVKLEKNLDAEIERAVSFAVERGARALLVSADPLYNNRRELIVALAAKHSLPAVYPWRLYAAAGGLASYGPSITDAYLQIGRYAGRILNGAKPGELPVLQPSIFELVINLKTARALGLTVSPWLLATATETIE
jgi:putative ABC transport system substrate-binding protein